MSKSEILTAAFKVVVKLLYTSVKLVNTSVNHVYNSFFRL